MELGVLSWGVGALGLTGTNTDGHGPGGVALVGLVPWDCHGLTRTGTDSRTVTDAMVGIYSVLSGHRYSMSSYPLTP